jgi:hypothetical protein
MHLRSQCPGHRVVSLLCELKGYQIRTKRVGRGRLVTVQAAVTNWAVLPE